MTENERRLITDSLFYYREPTEANREMWIAACEAILADRKVVPPGGVLILRDRPDGPILPGIDPRTGKRIARE